MRVETETLADGVYLIGGGTHNSMAVEFAAFIVVFDAPLSEARSLAVIEEIVKLIPNKPIRLVVNSHQHFDHTGGLRAYNHIGATVITHWKNYDFLQPRRDQLRAAHGAAGHGVALAADRARRRVLLRDRARELRHHRRTRTMQIHYVNPLDARRRHADGVSAEGEAAARSRSRRTRSSRCRRG